MLKLDRNLLPNGDLRAFPDILSRLTLCCPCRFLSIAGNSPGMFLAPPFFRRLVNTTISESCIKGHRSSSCTHTERPLYEIKKKGRPVSQCERCRQLRNTKKVHSKCTCSEGSPSQTREVTDRVFGTKRQPFPES